MIAIAFECGPVHPGLTSWGILSRPCGTGLDEFVYPGLRPGLFSTVPTGLIAIWAKADLFSASALEIGRIKKVNLDKIDSALLLTNRGGAAAEHSSGTIPAKSLQHVWVVYVKLRLGH
jgi:hypothetical protein